MAEEEGDQGDTELVTLDVEKPLFYHGPRLPGFGAEIAGVQSLATLCYSAAYDLVFTAKDTEVLAYCGQELVRSLSTDGKASEPRCRLGRGGGPVTFLSTSGEGTDGSLRDCGLLCVASAGGRLCFYSLEEADNGRAKEVYSTTLENEEVVELRWRLDDVLCVCDGGRTFLVQPLASSVACVHDVVEFTPCCVGVDPRSDIALLGGTPPANDDTCANLWALDLGTSESWPLFIEGIPQESEDHLGYATLRGIRMLGSHGSDANGGVSAACLFVVEDGDNGPLTLQVIVSISADWRKATLKALSINELFMEDFADQVIMHSVWVPEWSMLMMGISASADIVLISSDSKEDLGPCGWVALAPPEGKKLGCPNTVAQDATTSLRGLCLVTSFKGEVPRKGGSADAQKLVSPPVVLLAASDGSLSVHYCDHHLPTPKDTPKPKAGSSPSVMRSSSAVPAASPFAGSGGLASPSPFGSAVGVSASPFGSAVGVSASPFGSAAGGSTFASPFAGSLSGSPFASAAGASGGASASGPLFGGTQVSSPFGVGGSTAGVSTSLSAGPFAAQSMASSPCAPGAAGVSSNTSTSASPFAPAAGSAKQAEAPSGAVGATKPLTSLGVQNIAQSSESPQKDWCRENITKVYREHNPSKLEEIDNLMKKYGGKEVELYEKVCKKYSVTALKYSDSSVANQVQSSAGSAGSSPGSLFGGAAAASAGASTGSPFGGDAAPAGSSSGSLFGSSTGGLAGPSLFGGVASAGSGSLFGGAAAVASAGAAPGSLFGGVAASAGASSGSLFGGAAAVSAGAASGSLFGGVAAATGSSPGSLSSAAVTSGISDPATQSSERDWCQEQITQVYKEHNASKLTEVEALLAKHVGKEMQLYERVCKKYGIAASQFPGATVGGTTAVVAAPAGVIAESTPATGLFGSAAGSSSLFGGTGTKVSDAAGGLFGEVPALGSLGLSGLGLGDGLGKKPASSETVSAFTGASPPPASKLLAGGPKDDGLQGRQAATKKLLTALRAPSKDSAFAPLFPACEALEKELAQMESEEVVSPNAGKNWGDFSQQVAAAETNSAAISADLKKMDCLKTPQVFSELAELQSRTLQHYSRFISEGPASQHQGSEGPRLTAIRARCAEIQEELVSLEQELLEKFRNKIDLREDDLNVSAGSYFEPSSRLSGPAFEESSLGGLLSANSCRRPTRFGYGSRTCGSFGNRSTPAARNPLRAPRTGGQEATLGEMVNGGGAVMKHSSSSRPCLQQPGQDGDDRRWFLQSRAEQEQQRSRELNERALDLAERASEAAKAVAASSVKLPGGGSSSSSSLGTGAATASSIAAASCQGPVRRLRASLYSQLTSLASRAPRRRVKRSDHLALDRGALEMCGEANTQSEIDTPTFGSRSDFFSGLGSSNHGSGNGEPFGKRSASGADDEKLLMPPPTGLPSKSKGSPRLGFGTSEPTLPSTSGAGLDFGSASSASSSSGGLFGGGKGGLFGASEGGLFGASSAASGSSLFGASSTAASSSGAEAGSSSSSSSSALGGLFAASPQTAVSASSSASFGSLFGSSAPSAPAAQQVDVKQAYKERMLKIYQQHNPSKVDEIDALMAKYVGQEHVMYSKICIKYKVQPEPEIKAGAVEVALLAATAGAAPAAATAAPAAGGMFGAPAAGGAFGAPAAGGMFGAPAAAPQAAPSSSAGFGASSLFGASAGASAAPAAAASLFGGAAAPAAVIPDVKQAYKDRMVRIYQQHNPGKVGEIDSLMAKYVGQEHVMYLKICAKYKVQPEVEIKAGAAAAAAPAAGGLFGAPAAAAPAFGSAPSGGGGLFGAAPCGGGASLFGAPSAAAPQTGGPFGAPASSGGAFGAPAAGGMFGAPAAGGTFGAPAAGGAFGAPAAGGVFGAPAASGAFGAPAAGGMFGAPAAAPAAGGMFGQAAAASPFGGAVQSSPFGASAPAAGVPGLLDECRARVNAIYQQFNPGKLGEVETLLAKYRGKEQELYFKVCKKYNINPPPPLASAAAAPQAPVGGGGFFGAQAAPAPSAFGGGGGFGQPQAPGGAFGAPAAAGQGFGGSPFGAPAVGGAFGGASASPFGGGAAPAFGAPSGLLGGAPAFGSPSQLGGAANPFGRAASSSPSPFGGGMGGGGFASLSQQPGSFGSSPFGAAAPATMSPFGAPAAASPFGGGASASPFGGGNQWTSHRG